MGSKEAKKKPSGIQSLARASAILEEIADHREGITLVQLCKAVGLHSSTAFHIAKTLLNLGYLRQDEMTKLYRIGPLVFRLASSAFDEVEMANTAGPFLHALAIRTGETSQLAIRSGREAVIVARSEALGAFRMTEDGGVTRPMHATAIGKVLLAALTPSNLDALLAEIDLKPLTSRTITDLVRLRDEVRKIAETGLALEEGEFHPEIRCVAVPIRNFVGDVIASLGISAPVWRLSRDDQRQKAAILTSVAQDLSVAFGHREGSDRGATDLGVKPARTAIRTMPCA